MIPLSRRQRDPALVSLRVSRPQPLVRVGGEVEGEHLRDDAAVCSAYWPLTAEAEEGVGPRRTGKNGA